jgi:ParB/RepB/Spo0J family partition protein
MHSTLSLIRSPFQLRPVRKNTLEYVQLRDSIRKQGILQPLLITPNLHIVDGAHRHEAALDLKLLEVPTLVRDLTEEQILSAQVATNIHRIETLDSELASRLWTISKLLPVESVASSFGKSIPWVRKVCSLERLSLECRAAFDKRVVTFRQACLLAKLPRKHQRQCLGLDEAQLMFVVREYLSNSCIPKEMPQVSHSFKPISKVMAEEANPKEAGQIILNETDLSPVQVWRAALRWAMQMDVETKKRRQILFDKRNPQSTI